MADNDFYIELVYYPAVPGITPTLVTSFSKSISTGANVTNAISGNTVVRHIANIKKTVTSFTLFFASDEDAEYAAQFLSRSDLMKLTVTDQPVLSSILNFITTGDITVSKVDNEFNPWQVTFDAEVNI